MQLRWAETVEANFSGGIDGVIFFSLTINGLGLYGYVSADLSEQLAGA
jgi:hypothetical protein